MAEINIIKRKNVYSYILIGILFLLLIFRVRFGFDQSDESHYYALAKRFCNGDIPFIHEWHPSQFSAILLCPFYLFYKHFVPSGDGVILAGRYAYVAIQIIVSLYLLHILKDKKYSWQVVVLYLMCSRQNIPGLSYYNLFLTGCIVAVLSLVHYLKKGEDVIYVVVAGVGISVATICMPFLAIGVAIYTVVSLLHKKYKMLGGFWGAIVLCAVIYIGVLLQLASLSDYLASIKYVVLNPTHTGTSMAKVIRTLLQIGKSCILGVPGLIYLLIRLKKISIHKEDYPVVFEAKDDIVFIASLFACGLIPFGAIVKPGNLYINLTVLPIPYILKEMMNFKYHRDKANLEGIVLYLTGLFIAFFFWLGSDTNATCLPLGFLISVIGIIMIIEDSFSKNNEIAFIVVLILFAILARLCGPTFRDNYWWKLDTKIEYGPAKELYTEKADAEEYYSVCELLDKCEEQYQKEELKNKKILITAFLPWGYLYSDCQNASYTTWTAPLSSSQLEEYYDLHPDRFPDIVLVISDDYGNINGLDGGGKIYPYNPKEGIVWEKIKNWKCVDSGVGKIYL